jgi:hypothetical protein
LIVLLLAQPAWPALQAAPGASRESAPGTRSTWEKVKSWAGQPGTRDVALVTGAAVGAVAAVVLLPSAALAVPALGAYALVGGLALKTALGAAVGATVLTKIRAGIAGREDRSRSSFLRDTAMVAAGGFGPLAAFNLLPAAGVLAGTGGGIAKLAIGGVAGGALFKGADRLFSGSSPAAPAEGPLGAATGAGPEPRPMDLDRPPAKLAPAPRPVVPAKLAGSAIGALRTSRPKQVPVRVEKALGGPRDEVPGWDSLNLAP